MNLLSNEPRTHLIDFGSVIWHANLISGPHRGPEFRPECRRSVSQHVEFDLCHTWRCLHAVSFLSKVTAPVPCPTPTPRSQMAWPIGRPRKVIKLTWPNPRIVRRSGNNMYLLLWSVSILSTSQCYWRCRLKRKEKLFILLQTVN